MLKKLRLPVLALGAALTFLGPTSALAQYLTPHQVHEQQEQLRRLRHQQRRMSRGYYYYGSRSYDPFSTDTVVYNWWGDPIGYYDWWGYFHPYW